MSNPFYFKTKTKYYVSHKAFPYGLHNPVLPTGSYTLQWSEGHVMGGAVKGGDG